MLLLYFAVILQDKGGYSVEEKDFLLVSMVALQEYLQQSVSVVNKFFVKFLLSWDGYCHCKEVQAFTEWFSFDSIEGNFFCSGIIAPCAITGSSDALKTLGTSQKLVCKKH